MLVERPDRITPVRNWARTNVLTIVLIIFILLSMLLHVLTIGAYFRIREIVSRQLSTAATQIAVARQQTVHYDFPVQQSFPVSTTVQLNETFVVPINMTVPIQENITVPIEVPILGQFDLPVPIDFDVPISTTVSVSVDKEIPISTSVDLNTDIPIDLDLSQPPLGDVLKELEETLRELLEQL